MSYGADEVFDDETRTPMNVFAISASFYIIVCILIHLSSMNGTSNTEMNEYHTKKKLASSFNRLKFLKNCILEQVLPKSAPQQLKSKDHPFSASARCYLEEACHELK